MRTLPLSLLLAAVTACGSTPPSNGGTSGGATGGSSGGTGGSGFSITSFVGNYSCTYAGTYTLTGSAVPQSNTDSGSAVFSAGTTTDLQESGLITGTALGPCNETYDLTSATTAVFSPPQQSCHFTQTNGNDQTNTDTATLTLTSTGLSDAVNGTFVGTTPAGTAYSGSFSGTWTCTRG
jgi:hypothetical protein